MADQVRVRFAPSPTGHLHIGGLRSAIFNWLFAKKNNGKFLIRIEDTDVERSKQEYTDSILDSFNWMSINSDEPIFNQTDRIPEYLKLIQKLIDEGKAYRCFCAAQDKSELPDLSDAPGYSKYDRTCLGKELSDTDLIRPHVVRFKIPDSSSESFVIKDLIYGDVVYPYDQFDDFIILRSNGQPIYNFCVVADDIYQKITHIIRGQEHLVNTPKQIFLYEALGEKVPTFAHLPLILGPSGAKLSKRDAATSVISYKYDGYLPDAIFNYLVRLGWAHGDQEVFTRQEVIDLFELKDVNRAGAIFDIKKLDWLNGVYIRAMSSEDILNYILNNIDENFRRNLSIFDDIAILKLISLYKERVKTLKELIQEIVNFGSDPVAYDLIELQQYTTQELQDRLKILEDLLINLVEWNELELTASIKNLCKEHNLKLPDIAKPLRVALTGRASSPGIFELLALLSKESSLKRIGGFLSKLE